MFAFAADLADEGVESVLANVQGRGGMDGVTLAVVYHEARDLLPHNPRGKLRFLEGGVTSFRPDPTLYRGLGVEPRPSALARFRDMLDELSKVAAARGLAVHGWTVFLHSDWVPNPRPDLAERNAFGDPMLTELCPANPAVRGYVTGLSTDIARRGVRTVMAESLHYHPLEHGFHHERYFFRLGATTRFLLGLCFCEHCGEAARADGVDADTLRQFTRDRIQQIFDGREDAGDTALWRDEVASLASGEMGGYLAMRERVVSTLAGEAARAAAAEGVGFSFLDASGAVKGYVTGKPEGGPAPEIAWQLGVDLAAIARATSGLEAMAYAADPDRVALDLAAYAKLLPEGGSLAAAMRPMLPDCDSTANLAAKLRVADEGGAGRVDFYHYGLAPLTALDRIREALESGAAEAKRPA